MLVEEIQARNAADRARLRSGTVQSVVTLSFPVSSISTACAPRGFLDKTSNSTGDGNSLFERQVLENSPAVIIGRDPGEYLCSAAFIVLGRLARAIAGAFPTTMIKRLIDGLRLGPDEASNHLTKRRSAAGGQRLERRPGGRVDIDVDRPGGCPSTIPVPPVGAGGTGGGNLGTPLDASGVCPGMVVEVELGIEQVQHGPTEPSTLLRVDDSIRGSLHPPENLTTVDRVQGRSLDAAGHELNDRFEAYAGGSEGLDHGVVGVAAPAAKR